MEECSVDAEPSSDGVGVTETRVLLLLLLLLMIVLMMMNNFMIVNRWSRRNMFFSRLLFLVFWFSPIAIFKFLTIVFEVVSEGLLEDVVAVDEGFKNLGADDDVRIDQADDNCRKSNDKQERSEQEEVGLTRHFCFEKKNLK